MARRKKKKNKKMDKHKFKLAVCTSCDICAFGFKPKFCFNKVYKKNPNRFMSHVPDMLREHNALIQSVADADPTANYMAGSIFKKIFCDANACHGCEGNVHQVVKCLNMFKLQASGGTDSLIVSTVKKFKKVKNRNKNNKSKVPAVVTIISSQNDKFLKEVDRILANHAKQSNKDTES